MNKSYIEYPYSFVDGVDFARYVSDPGITSNPTIGTLTDNQYNYAFNHEITMQSDGTKRCGFIIDLPNRIIHGDLVKTELELMSITGYLPIVVYEEYKTDLSAVRKYESRTIKNIGGYELVKLTSPVPNFYGEANARVFVGLEIGQAGRFCVRFPMITHKTQNRYKPSIDPALNRTKMFQLTKTTGAWALDPSTSYRKLDGGTVTVTGATPTGKSLTISFATPFVVDVPQVFAMSNGSTLGYSIHFGFRAKGSIELFVCDQTGAQIGWSTVADGSVINVMAVPGLYT